MSGIREALESAYEEVGGGEESASPEAPVEAPTPADSSGGDASPSPEPATVGPVPAPDAEDKAPPPQPRDGGRSRDGKGRFAGGKNPTEVAEAMAAKVATRAPGEDAKPDAAKPAAPAPAPAPAPEALRAPQSWKPAAREAWTKVPAEIQAEVNRREKEMASGLQEAAHARKFAQDFQNTVRPYEGMIRAEGGSYLSAVDQLFQTAHALRTAPPAHKAAILANIVKTYGVPIDALDAALAGQAAPQGQSNGQPPPYQDPRVDQLFASIEQAKQQRSHATAQRAQSDIQAFREKAEFIDDVRNHMSVLLSDAAQRGQDMTLQEAYDSACWSSKDVRAILQQREAAKAANAGNASTQRARTAASSVKGQPAGAPNAPQSKGIRAALEAAADELSGRR